MVLFVSNAFATGPSFINSEINPISINEKGEILCRTRFEKNPMGARTFMDVEYGVCILSKDTILQQTTQILSYTGYPEYEVYEQHRNYWNSIFESCLDSKKLSDIENSLKWQYRFNDCNVKSFERNDTVTIKELETKFKINLNTHKQQALYGAKSNPYGSNEDKIIILYDFGHIIITENLSYEDERIGIGFDYLVPLFGGIEYENYIITGVLFLNKK